jgi:hypothetical protein
MVSRVDLDQFIGSETFHEQLMVDGNKLILTEGCHFVRETYSAYWLFDLIGSYQFKLIDEPFQVWKLVKFKDECQITCDDGNGTRLLSQEIPFTDFPFDITIWQIEGTCLLPSEY